MMESRIRELPPGAALGRATCLLVDDLEENLLVLTALLQPVDVHVVTARSGAEALDLLLTHDVALVLLDVHMPEMDGFELAELMRGAERTRHIPVIFVTAGGREAHRTFKGYDLGAVDFLYKPIEPNVLLSKVAVFVELHRQKQLIARELRERTETLRLNELFAAVLGHDLRAPLDVVLTSTAVLEGCADDPDAVRRAARQIRASGQRMSRMIGDMLDLSRARLAGGIPVEREPTDLAAVVSRVIDECRTAHPSAGIDIEIVGDPRLQGDPERLAQVTSNLVINAIVHGAAGAPVHVKLDGRDRTTLTLSVRNVGEVSSDALPHLFEAFRRPAHAGRADGLGLGLFITQQIVVAHEGSVTVESAHGSTTIHVRVPRDARPPWTPAPVRP